MNLTITKAETQPNRSTAIRSDGRRLEESTRMSSGTFETPHGVMEWDKYFITNHTLKTRADFVVIRSREVPPFDETFARLNRAATLGKRAVKQANVVLGARLNPEVAVPEDSEACGVRTSTDMEFGVEFPVGVPALTEVRELDIKEDGEGLFWLRLSNRRFDLYADNPATSEHPTLGVFIPTETPGVTSADPEHIRWQYADALLTPITAELPGALGDISIRAALLGLKPGVTAS
jgi:hypothetical protein